MFGEKFVDFYDNLIKCSQTTKEKLSKIKKTKINNTDEEEEVINDYDLNDKSKVYIEKHINTLIDTQIKKFLENNNNSQKYSCYLKMIQNIYCDISEFSNLFPNFKSLKMTLKLYFIMMRTYYYNNQRLEKMLTALEEFTMFIDYFFKEIILYTIKIFPNIDINNKGNINELNVDNTIINAFLGDALPFIKNNNNNKTNNSDNCINNNTEEIKVQIPLNILYNIYDYRHDIMKDINNKGKCLKKYFEKQENSANIINIKNEENKKKIHLGLIIYFLNEIKEKYFVDRFIKYLELNEEDKNIVLNNILKNK